MCTVSIVRPGDPGAGDGAGLQWRLVCNRDEQRARPAALAPAVGTVGRHRLASPIDPVGPGTWVAASSAGLGFALLNGRGDADDQGAWSRGRIIPLLAGASSLDDVDRYLGRLRNLRTRPFTLLVIGQGGVLEVVSDGRCLLSSARWNDARVMRTSSSVDPDGVSDWRRREFDRRVPRPDVAAQDAFHEAPDAGVPARGVLMSRPDACTVSITIIELWPSHLRLAYRPRPGGGTGTVIHLPCRP